MTTFGSVCSGIEAASVAWHPLGWRAAWLSEIEPFPCAVLAHHYPDVPNLGDMTKIAPLIRDGFVPAPDVFCGGTPCQAFSVAGLRNSLDDARGNLTLTFCEIANEIDARRAAAGLLPSVIFWENVPGVLTTKDNAFGCFLGALAGEDGALVPPGAKWSNAGCVFGPERTVAWRVLDAQYFGVAQRRRRVFVVASAREGFDPTEVLFEFDGVRRDTAPSREAGQDAAGTLASRTDGGGFPGTDEASSGYVQPVCPTLRAGGNRTGGDRPPGTDVDTADSLIALSVALRGRDGGATAELGDEVAVCLRASTGGGDKPHVLAPIAFSSKDYGGDAEIDLPPAIAFDSRQDPVSSQHVFGALGSSSPQAQAVAHVSTMPTLRAEGFDASEDGTGRGQPIVAAVAFTTEQTPKFNDECALTLTKQSPTGGGQIQSVLTGMAVRRLTPRECERLQAFPDDYTLIPVRGKPAADGPRYKALGNSWCVFNARWIGARIDRALRARVELAA